MQPGTGYPPGYPPGYGYGYGYGAPMPVYRPTGPRTLGTLSMVFGGLVTVTSLFGLLLGRQIGNFTQVSASQQEAFDAYLRSVHTASMALSALMLVMSASLFWIGRGQRSYQRWAVKASLVWGAIALVVLAINFVVQLTVMLPALEKFIDSISHGSQPLPMGSMMKVSAVVGVLFYAPYPIILLVAFRRPNVVAAMDQPPVAPPAAGVF